MERIAYRPLVDASARASLIDKGLARDPQDADQRLGGVRAANS